MSKTTNKYSSEVRECAVRMVLGNEHQHVSSARSKVAESQFPLTRV